jgi:hypothetical protein
MRTTRPCRTADRHCAHVPWLGAIIFVVQFICAAMVPASAAPKTDIVVFLNGDRLTGEVKSLEQGRLKFKTDATGTIEIEWNKVATVQTSQVLQVETIDGLRFLGTAPDLVGEGQMQLQLWTRPTSLGKTIALPDIVRIATIDQGGLIQRLDGYVTAGFDYTKANNLQEFDFSGGLNSRTEKRQWQVDGSSTVTTQDGIDDASRFNVTGSYRHFRPERWFVQGFGGLEGNTELGLDLRTTLGAAYGRYLQQTNERDWAAYAGVAVIRESFTGTEENESIEAVFGTQYSFFRYDSPEASFDVTWNLLPSLTESGRVRSEGRLRTRYEIASDLFFEVSLYGTYDSDPGEEANSNSDYGLVTSLGYSF